MTLETKSVKQLAAELAQKLLEIKKVLVLIGKNKKPVDKDDAIIFHIDI